MENDERMSPIRIITAGRQTPDSNRGRQQALKISRYCPRKNKNKKKGFGFAKIKI
jgi:hypothetical protein